MTFSKIILSIPHAATDFPNDAALGKWSDAQKLRAEMTVWTDFLTDKIFSPSGSSQQRIATVVFPYSRYYCDVERLPDDPLEAIGQGIIYEKLRDDSAVRTLTDAEKSAILREWKNYQKLLASELVPDALLIDCHSFPEFIAPDIDICIGFNTDASRPSDAVLQTIRQHFEQFGHKVAFNTPFANAITPQSDTTYKSLMIELNKKLYLRADLTQKPTAYKIHDQLDILYKKLLP
jgi:N-formylglutamate amidohydrolase